MNKIGAFVYVCRQIDVLEENGWQCKIENNGWDKGEIVVRKNFKHKPFYVFRKVKKFKQWMKKWRKGKIK